MRISNTYKTVAMPAPTGFSILNIGSIVGVDGITDTNTIIVVINTSKTDDCETIFICYETYK